MRRHRSCRDGCCPPACSDGFSLIEALIATAVLTVGVLGLAQLLVAATTANAKARAATTAAILARGKLEELRSVPWAGLLPSPPNALTSDVPGFVDYLTPAGEPESRTNAAFRRRWAIEALPADPPNAVVVQVWVQPNGGQDVPTMLAAVRTRWD